MYSKNFKYILVDEYQDTNLIQSKWLNYLSKYNKNICCVGDDDQLISAPLQL
jgi:DNA helicase-2/ATP-dependent DNA helicase PcrA